MSKAKIPDESTNQLRQRLDGIAGRSPRDIDFHHERIEALNAPMPADLVNVAATFPDILDEFFGVALSSLLEQAPDSQLEQCLIVYFKDNKAKHIGRVTGNRVISKWGKNPIYEHSLFEIAESYGDEYELFKQPSVHYITGKFIDFVRHHPRYIDIRDVFEEVVIECGYE